MRKGFSLLEMVVVIAISSILLTMVGLNFNALNEQATRVEIADSQKTIGSIIAQLVSNGYTITTGYYTPSSFQSAYGVPLPGNPLNSSDPLQGRWYIENIAGTYNVYAMKDDSVIASTKYVVNDDFPYIKNITKTVVAPSTAESSDINLVRDQNLLYDGSFEKSGIGWENTVTGSNLVGLSPDAYHGNKSLMVIATKGSAVAIEQAVSISNLPLDRYHAVMHFKNVSADPIKTHVTFNVSYTTPTATVFSYSWNPTLSYYAWQEMTFTSSAVGSTTGTLSMTITVSGDSSITATGYVLIDDLGIFLLPGGE